MAIKQNPRATYKAQLLNYDALLLASDDECSYCLSQREVEMMLAFVDYIGWKTRYQPTSTEIDQNLIDNWSANLARKLMSGCCGDDGALHRFNEAGIYQTSTDGGITWQDDPAGDPRNDGIGAPPIPGPASDGKRCAAADNVRGLFEQYRDNLIEIVGATPTVLAIIAGILAFIGTILGLSGVGIGIGVLFLTMAAEIISLGGTGISGAITFTALENFRCMVYCRMNTDGELTYEAWQALLGDIAIGFDGFAETFFYQTVAGMGYIGVNNAATMGAATADDCGDCGCSNLCADKYSIWDRTGEGIPITYYGTILERDHDRIRVQFNTNYIVLAADIIDDCCVPDHWTLVSGGAAFATAYNDCGHAFTGEMQHPVAWEGHCAYLIEMQALGEDRPVVDIFFSGECI